MQPNPIRDFKPCLLSSVLYGPHNLPGNALPNEGIVQGRVERHELTPRFSAGVPFGRLGFDEQVLGFKSDAFLANGEGDAFPAGTGGRNGRAVCFGERLSNSRDLFTVAFSQTRQVGFDPVAHEFCVGSDEFKRFDVEFLQHLLLMLLQRLTCLIGGHPDEKPRKRLADADLAGFAGRPAERNNILYDFGGFPKRGVLPRVRGFGPLTHMHTDGSI